MSVRERILAIRIAEAISKHPEIAEELGISAELAECRAVLKEPHEGKTMGNYKDRNLETLQSKHYSQKNMQKQAPPKAGKLRLSLKSILGMAQSITTC